MGYLTDNIGPSRVADGHQLYPFVLLVEWVVTDPFIAPAPRDQLAAVVARTVTDPENWMHGHDPRPDRARFRFATEGHRAAAAAALVSLDPYPIRVVKVTQENEPT